MKDDTISRAAAIDAFAPYAEYESNRTNAEWVRRINMVLSALPPTQPSVSKEEMVGDVISRQALLDAVDGVDWYHQNQHGEMVHGANSDEHQAWYKAEDIYHVLDTLPSAQPEIIHCKDCKFYGRVDKRRFYRGSDCLNRRIDTIVPDRDFCSRAEMRGEAWMMRKV